MTPPSLHHIIDGLYEASRYPTGWQATLDLLSRHLQARSAILFYRHHRLQQASLVAHSGLAEEQVLRLAESLPWDEHDRNRNLSMPGELHPISPIRHANSDNESRYQQLGIAHAARGWLFDDREHSALLELHRGEESPPFETAELDTVSTLSEHFERALRIHAVEVIEQQRHSSLAGGLAQLALGVVLFNAAAQVVYRNDMANRLLDTHPALLLLRQRLTAAEPRQAERLRQAITAAINSQDSDEEGVSALCLGDGEESGALHCWVMPLANGRTPQGEGIEQAVAALFVSDPASASPLQPEPLMALYGLSKKEAEVAVGIAAGHSVEEIAQLYSRSLNTVRTHLKGVYRKTGVRRQAELVRLILDGSHLFALLPTVVQGGSQRG